MTKTFFKTKSGLIIHGNALNAMPYIKSESINLILTSPPFSLLRKKEYGNVNAQNYNQWFKPFAIEFKRILHPKGSLIIDIGGSWIPKIPARNLYHFKLLLMLCEELNFYLAQEFYWYNPAKLPTPAQWVTIKRIRAKDSVNCIWWLSKSPFPKANNSNVLIPYSPRMKNLLKKGYTPKKRPSGHNISSKFSTNNNGAIPPNLLSIPNTQSNTPYLNYCKKNNLKPHPARFPIQLPEFFIKMLTNEKDIILDPFSGSCTTGKAAQLLNRKWICIELHEKYLHTALSHFLNT